MGISWTCLRKIKVVQIIGSFPPSLLPSFCPPFPFPPPPPLIFPSHMTFWGPLRPHSSGTNIQGSRHARFVILACFLFQILMLHSVLLAVQSWSTRSSRRSSPSPEISAQRLYLSESYVISICFHQFRPTTHHDERKDISKCGSELGMPHSMCRRSSSHDDNCARVALGRPSLSVVLTYLCPPSSEGTSHLSPLWQGFILLAGSYGQGKKRSLR